VSNSESRKAKPIVKWAGGKRRLASEIKSHFPIKFGTYIEPFLGGAAVFLELDPAKAILSDANNGLINLYKHVRDQCAELEISLTALENKYNNIAEDSKEALYYEIRQRFNQEDRTGLEKARDFLFLNKTGFNGMYRESKKGNLNIPFGKKSRVTLFCPDNLRLVSKRLKNTKLSAGDYRESVARAKSGDLIYLDPPYLPLSNTSSFTAYHKNDFKIEQQNQLAEVIQELDARGVFVVLSNAFHEDIESIYSVNFPNFEISEIQASRTISARAAGRGRSKEYLISNVQATSKTLKI
jgi:DNA adenine methylase